MWWAWLAPWLCRAAVPGEGQSEVSMAGLWLKAAEPTHCMSRARLCTLQLLQEWEERARKGASPQEVAFKLIQCLCIQPVTEISTAVVWVWCLLVSETSWPRES